MSALTDDTATKAGYAEVSLENHPLTIIPETYFFVVCQASVKVELTLFTAS